MTRRIRLIRPALGLLKKGIPTGGNNEAPSTTFLFWQ
jgi:hypothetical protein